MCVKTIGLGWLGESLLLQGDTVSLDKNWGNEKKKDVLPLRQHGASGRRHASEHRLLSKPSAHLSLIHSSTSLNLQEAKRL